MDDFAEQTGAIIDDIAGMALDALPAEVDAAELMASVRRRDASISLGVGILDTRTGEVITDASEPLFNAVCHLHQICGENDQEWVGFRLRLERTDSGDWSVKAEFRYDDPEAPPEEPAFDAGSMSDGFRRLLAEQAGIGVEKQNRLEEVVQSAPWRMSVDERQLEFEGRFACEMDLIGTASYVDNNWLWAWANEGMKLSDKVSAASRRIRDQGEQEGIWEFTAPDSDFNRLHCDYLALIACGQCEADFYFWARYDEGAALLVGYSDEVKASLSSDVIRVTTTIPQALELVGEHVDHRQMCLHYLSRHDYKIEESKARVEAVSPQGDVLEVTFDELGRLSGLSSKTS